MSTQLVARWILKDPYSLEADPVSKALRVFINESDALERTANGIQVKSGGITNDHLAGSISDDKLASQYIFADGSRPFTGNQSMNGYKLTNLANPTDVQDAATKSYVDSAIAGLKWRDPVDYSISYVLDTSGATPTGTASNGEHCLNTADNKLFTYNNGWDSGTDVSVGQRFLFNEDGSDTSGNSGTYTADNKVYGLTDSGWVTETPVNSWALFRREDEMGFVFDGDTNRWIQFTGTGQIAAGNGLYKEGNVLHVGAGNGIQVLSDSIQLTALTSDWDLGGTHTIINVPDPTNAQDVATKNYVDNAVSAIHDPRSYTYTITSTDITNKYFTLPDTPDNGDLVHMVIEGAPSLTNGSSFAVVDNKISWDGYDLDGLIEAGDKVFVRYYV